MTAISDSDDFTTAPEGPPNGGARSSTLMRSYLGQVNNRVRFVYNRLISTIFGTYSTFESSAVNTATDRITITAHGLVTNDPVRFSNVGGTLFAPASATSITNGVSGGVYYAIKIDDDTIQLATSSGGSALDITTQGSGTHYIWKVVEGFNVPVTPGFTTTAGFAIPAGSLRSLLQVYYLPKIGGTVTGPLTLSGDDARFMKRATEDIPDSNSDIDVTADVWYQATPTAQRDHEILDAGAVNGDEVEVRRGASGNFAIVLHREGAAGAICTLPALTCCSARLKRKGGVWTLLSYSGAVTPGADAG